MTDIVEEMAKAMCDADLELAALVKRAINVEGDSDSPMRVAAANELYQQADSRREQYQRAAQAAYTIVERRIGERIEAAFREGWTDGYHNGRGGSVIDPEPDWLESEARASLEQRSDPKGSNP